MVYIQYFWQENHQIYGVFIYEPQLRLPLHQQPQPRLHPSGSSSEGGDGCSAKLYNIYF